MTEARQLPPEVRNADERATLVAMLDLYRAVLVRKASGLTVDELQRTVGVSPLTIGGLVKHMAYVERTWFAFRFGGHGFGEPWADAPWADDPDWEMHSAEGATASELIALLDGEVAEAREVIATISDLDTVAPQPGHLGPYNLRWTLVHLIEEYARHCGHADLIRESIDGATGD